MAEWISICINYCLYKVSHSETPFSCNQIKIILLEEKRLDHKILDSTNLYKVLLPLLFLAVLNLAIANLKQMQFSLSGSKQRAKLKDQNGWISKVRGGNVVWCSKWLKHMMIRSLNWLFTLTLQSYTSNLWDTSITKLLPPSKYKNVVNLTKKVLILQIFPFFHRLCWVEITSLAAFHTKKIHLGRDNRPLNRYTSKITYMTPKRKNDKEQT